MPIPSILNAAHSFAAQGLEPGGLAIDATVGNGHDTLFLVREVGAGGSVLGFDVQADALRAARQHVHSEAPRAADRLRLVHDGHEALRAHLDEAAVGTVGAVSFNLGYLPGGDHSITTQPNTTLDALDASLTVLRPGGRITVVAYPGHDGGRAEMEAVADWASTLPQDRAEALSYRFVNQANDPPRLYVIEKRTADGA